MLVSRHEELIDFARAFRNYGKPEHAVSGLNFRLSEFTAALGLVQTERMEEIVGWKNEAARRWLDPVHPGRLQLPDGMVSGLYKYIVFDPLERSTGKVYDQPCHRIMGHPDDLPNADWVASNHWCAPLYYRPRDRGRGGTGQPVRRDQLEHARQRRDRRAPGVARGVVVGVVQQQHVA